VVIGELVDGAKTISKLHYKVLEELKRLIVAIVSKSADEMCRILSEKFLTRENRKMIVSKRCSYLYKHFQLYERG